MFAYIVAIDKLTNDPIAAALIIPLKSIGSSIGSLCSPYLFRKIDNRFGLVFSQFILFLLSFIIASLFALGHDKFLTSVILTFSILQGFVGQYFQNTKELYSKTIEEINENKDDINLSSKALITALENGVLIGQLFGSALFFILYSVLKSSMYFAIYFDSLTFFIASCMCIGLPNLKIYINHEFKFKSLIKYIFEDKNLKYIFLYRSIILWITYGIFNIALFGIVKERFMLPIEYTALIYSLGGFTSYFLTNRFNTHVLNSENWKLMIVGMILYAFTIIIFSNESNMGFIALSMIVLNTFGCTLIKISSRDILRLATTKETFGDVFSIEFVIGKFVETSVASLFFILTKKYAVTYSHGIYFAAVVLLISLPIVIKFKNHTVRPTIAKNLL